MRFCLSSPYFWSHNLLMIPSIIENLATNKSSCVTDSPGKSITKPEPPSKQPHDAQTTAKPQSSNISAQKREYKPNPASNTIQSQQRHMQSSFRRNKSTLLEMVRPAWHASDIGYCDYNVFLFTWISIWMLRIKYLCIIVTAVSI